MSQKKLYLLPLKQHAGVIIFVDKQFFQINEDTLNPVLEQNGFIAFQKAYLDMVFVDFVSTNMRHSLGAHFMIINQ